MRAPGLLLGVALLATSLTGCSLFHPHASQQAQAPPLQTGNGALEQEEKKEHQAPPPSSPPQPVAQASVPPPLPPVSQPKVKHPKKHKHPDKSQPPADTTQRASTAASQQASSSPIGQLTTGDNATQAEAKHNTLLLIDSTEKGLSGIKRSLSTEEQAIVTQIRTFLKQAQQALATGDSDGALTLATKAKLLLDELTKS